MKKNGLYLFLLVSLVIISFTSASDIGGAKQNEVVELYQMCDNCTYVNLTSVTYPNKTVEVIGEYMTNYGNDYVYSFANTSSYGNYKYNVCGDKDDSLICEVHTFDISPSGFTIGSGQSIGLFGSLILIILIGLIFLLIAIRGENKIFKMLFYSFAIIIFIISILYTVIIIQQTLFGFESILTGIESFWFVMKMLLSAGIVAAIVIVFLIMLKLWRIKRGLYDE